MNDRRVKSSAPGRGLRGASIVAAMVVGAGLGYGAALLRWGSISDGEEQLTALLNEQRQALDASISGQARAVEAASVAHAQLRSERDRREGERLVEFATRQSLERSVQEKDTELSGLREQLAFYEQLLPSGPPGTVSIRGFELTASPDFLRYRVLLMRSGRPAGDAFKGSLQFVAEGMQDGELRTLTLEPLVVSATPTSGDAPDDRQDQNGPGRNGDQAPGGNQEPAGQSDIDRRAQAEAQRQPGQGSPAVGDAAAQAPDTGNTLAVEFGQYQRSQGLLAIPAGFQVRSVTLNVLEGSVVRASRQIEPTP